MIKKIHIVINPASGQPQEILNQINNVLHPADVEWGVSITQKSGDASRFASQAIDDGADLVAAYGGDGTVMEVAQAVQGGKIPMAILPGGTANLMSVELGVPKDLTEAAKIMVDPNSVIRYVDMGQLGEQRFMLRVGMGFAGNKVKLADRELKDKWGILAYSIAGLWARWSGGAVGMPAVPAAASERAASVPATASWQPRLALAEAQLALCP